MAKNHDEKKRRVIFLGVFGNFFLLTGSVLAIVGIFIPGVQIVVVPYLLLAGAFSWGGYLTFNFFYFGIFDNIRKLTAEYIKERRPLFNIWAKCKKLKQPTKSWMFFKCIIVPATTRAITTLAQEVQTAVGHLGKDVLPNIKKIEMAKLEKAVRLSDLSTKVAHFFSPKPDSVGNEFTGLEKAFFTGDPPYLGANSSEEGLKEIQDDAILTTKLNQIKYQEQMERLQLEEDIKKSAQNVPTRTWGRFLSIMINYAVDALGLVGNLTLIAGVIATFALPPVAPILLFVGAAMVGTYTGLYFGWNNINSIRKIAKNIRNERSIVFEKWCQEQEPSIKPGWNLRRFKAYTALIFWPAFTQAGVDLMQHIKTALSMSSDEIRSHTVIQQISNLHATSSKVQSGWTEIFGTTQDIQDFDNKLTLYSEYLMAWGYPSFDEGLKQLVVSENFNKKEASAFLIKALDREYELFEKLPTSEKEKRLKKSFQRTRGYQSSIETQKNKNMQDARFVVLNGALIRAIGFEEAAYKKAVESVNKKHYLTPDSLVQDMGSLEQLSEREEIEAKELAKKNKREMVWLKTYGYLLISFSTLMGLLSLIFPAIPLAAIIISAGVGAMGVLTYAAINIWQGIKLISFEYSKKYRDEMLPQYNAWLEAEKGNGREPSLWKKFIARLTTVTFPGIIFVLDRTNIRLGEHVSEAKESAEHIDKMYNYGQEQLRKKTMPENTEARRESDDNQVDPSNWMHDLLQIEGGDKITLGQMTFLDSHDSAAYTLNPFNGASHNTINKWATLPIVGGFVRYAAKFAAKTQSLSIKEQLETGVRSLDFRVAWDDNKQTFFLAHRLGCIDLSSALTQIEVFRKQHPDEVLFINFRPDYDNESTMNGHHEMLCDVVEQEIPNLFRNSDGNIPFAQLPLGQVRGKAIVTLESMDDVTQNHTKEAFFKHADVFDFKWLGDANSAEVKFEKLEKKEAAFCSQKGEQKKLCKLDGAPTPTTEHTVALIVHGVIPNFLYPVAKHFFSLLSPLVDHHSRFGKFITSFIDIKEHTLEKHGEKMADLLVEHDFSDDRRTFLPKFGRVYRLDYIGSETSKQLLERALEENIQTCKKIDTKAKTTGVPG